MIRNKNEIFMIFIAAILSITIAKVLSVYPGPDWDYDETTDWLRTWGVSAYVYGEYQDLLHYNYTKYKGGSWETPGVAWYKSDLIVRIYYDNIYEIFVTDGDVIVVERYAITRYAKTIASREFQSIWDTWWATAEASIVASP